EPWLTQVNKMTIYQTSISFTIIGIGSLLGNILGGILPQKFKINLIFYSILILQIISLITMNFKINFYVTQLALFLWSVSAFSIAPIVQTLAISSFTSIYPRVSASFNVAAFNLGISFSSYISTLNINSLGLEQLPIGSIFLIILSLPIVYIIFNLSNKNISLISSK
uniref:MFS transporter n=1 Tax=Acinetobacter oleivorans TaxID=1148157 RepID=UPI00148EF532